MSRKKILTNSIAAVLLTGSTSQLASANDTLTIIPQIAIQQKELDFSQLFVGGGDQRDGLTGGLSTKLPTAAFALTTVYDRFFISLKYETNYIDSFSFSEVAFSNAISNVDRDDFNITVGANIWQGLNGFAGYITGKTTIQPESKYIDGKLSDGSFPIDNRDCWDPSIHLNTDLPEGLCRPSVLSNPSKDHQLQGLAPYQQTYKEEGWFLGVSYGYQVGDTGTLTGSAAYAVMDGQYRDNFQTGTAIAQFNQFLYKGDSKGSSLALTWTAPLSSSVNYYIDGRRQTYKMNAKDQTGLFGGSVKSNEKMNTLTLGLQLYL